MGASAFSVLDLFLRLLVSVSVDCRVEEFRAFILDADDKAWGVLNGLLEAFPVAITISLPMLHF